MTEAYSLVLNSNDQCIHVSGELTFATVNAVLEQSEQVFKPLTSLDIDLSELVHSDSAGLALLVHWMRAANKENKKITFQNIPAQLLAIADVSGLDELLPQH